MTKEYEDAYKSIYATYQEWREVICDDNDELVRGMELSLKVLEEKSEAEEYRTPKKPSSRKLAPYSIGGGVYDEGLCPTCRNTVFEEQNFCLYCGQALDWSEAEE